MFHINLSRDRRVVLVRFGDPLTEADFTTLDSIARGRPASADRFDCVFDLSAIAKIDLATDFISRRGSVPQAFPDRDRFYVVPQHDLKLLVRLYGAYQEAKGLRPPHIVESLDQALTALGVSEGDFTRVRID